MQMMHRCAGTSDTENGVNIDIDITHLPNFHFLLIPFQQPTIVPAILENIANTCTTLNTNYYRNVKPLPQKTSRLRLKM